MLNLLAAYELKDIVIFIILFAVALKEIWTFCDWAWGKIKGVVKKSEEEIRLEEKINNNTEEIEKLKKADMETSKAILDMSKKIDLLINSDKDDIKAWITSQHHHWCNELGEIDVYSLDCLEKRYSHYKEENGNSFVEELMEDIRRLPKINSSIEMSKRDNK